MPLTPEVLARVRFLPIDAYAMNWIELRRYLLETIQLGDRQQAQKLCGDRGNRLLILGHNLGTSIEPTHETRLQQAMQQHS